MQWQDGGHGSQSEKGTRAEEAEPRDREGLGLATSIEPLDTAIPGAHPHWGWVSDTTKLKHSHRHTEADQCEDEEQVS